MEVVLVAWGLGLLLLDCLVTCRLDLGKVDLVVGLAYKLIKSNALVELHTRHTIDLFLPLVFPSYLL